jgi:hypothetical protein
MIEKSSGVVKTGKLRNLWEPNRGFQRFLG